MNSFRKNAGLAAASIACLLGLSTFSARATGLTPPYTGDYFATSVVTGGNPHTIWLNGASGSDYFQFADDSGLFSWPGSVAGDTATLNGTIVQNGTTGNRFDVSMQWEFRGTGAAGVGSGGPKCEGSACADNDTSLWTYFDLVAGTLTGTGDLIGLSLALTQAPAGSEHPMQLGYGANGKSPTDDFGLSTWFTWVASGSATGFTIPSTGQGDVNLVLTPVPLPAALPLFAATLGGAGLLGWRRRRTPA